jgi:hypothetical protein
VCRRAISRIRQPHWRTCGRGECAGVVREPVYTPPRNAPRRAHTLRSRLGSFWNASECFAPGEELLTEWSRVRVRPGELENQGVSGPPLTPCRIGSEFGTNPDQASRFLPVGGRPGLSGPRWGRHLPYVSLPDFLVPRTMRRRKRGRPPAEPGCSFRLKKRVDRLTMQCPNSSWTRTVTISGA